LIDKNIQNAVLSWLGQLEPGRPEDGTFTTAVVEAAGPLPILLGNFGPKGSTMDIAYSKDFAKTFAETIAENKYWAPAWSAYGDVKSAGDPDATGKELARARYWSAVIEWIKRL